MSVRIDGNLLLEILEETPATQNIMLMGKHGIGKSQILEKFYTAKGCKVVSLFLGQMSDPGDLIGIPHKNEVTGHTEFMPPYWFPTDDTPVVLFLDELNRARPEVLQTIMDLALNRKLAGRSLPAGSRIISAVNNGEEYQLTDLDPALVSRFNIYEFVPSVQDWLLWANKNGIDERITSYIAANPKALDNQMAIEDMENLEKTPDRRAWVRVSEIITGKEVLKQSHKSMIAGIVGGVAANRFFEFLDHNHLLTAKELLLGNFEMNRLKLESYKTPQFATINDAVFVYLESDKYGEADKKQMAENLASYFYYLEEKKLREAMAHFANMFSGTMYPNALVFIIGECPELYSKMTKFVAEIK
ncbi:MoxR-like ATPase [Treponema bryantii]|uniref:MoxR-like ATPase n=1 Tax=Treponema bryantii TaxID=163 RepID=A0A1I3LJA0_9SPIR|nr:AAA family ATPase [Treponema bryantii]SFI84834.1 MoxR-like ATPase [Treponema bryantii]